MIQNMGRFKFWSGDRSFLEYGGLWGWQIPGTRRFHLIELLNWEDAVGVREKAESGLDTYDVQLGEVDLADISEQRIKDALKSCGPDLKDIPEDQDAVTAEALWRYGARAPIWDESGDNWRKLFREAMKHSREVAGNASFLDGRTVNRMGSTARECMKGDVASPLLRKLDEGDPAAKLIAKMYQAADYQTLGGPADDIREVVEAHKEKL